MQLYVLYVILIIDCYYKFQFSFDHATGKSPANYGRLRALGQSTTFDLPKSGPPLIMAARALVAAPPI